MNWNTLNLLLADAPPMQDNPTGSMIKSFGFMGLIFFVMYFVMIRPQQKRAKDHENLLKTLKPGDKVLISGGIIGTVITVKDKAVSVRSADSKFEILKSAVTEITERGGEST